MEPILQRIAARTPAWARARLSRWLASLRNATWSVQILLGRVDRRVRPRAWPTGQSRIAVNLGCGTTDLPGFVNVDGFPHRHVHYVHRIDVLPMFGDGSVDVVYASHCLEHFRYGDVDRVLAEWARVLRPGGLLRLSVPDLDRLLAIHRDTGDPDDIVEQVMGGQNNRYNFHYSVFNGTNLGKRLARAGFHGIRAWVPGCDALAPTCDFASYLKTVNGKRYEVSLNLEADRD